MTEQPTVVVIATGGTIASRPTDDGGLVRAAVAAGMRGVVLEAFGAGNANRGVCRRSATPCGRA